MKFYTSDNDIPVSSIGGKAANLYILKKEGFNVPDWVVIPREVLAEKLPADIFSSNDYDLMRKHINEIDIPSSFIEEIISKFSGTRHFAVRSSATDEDGGDFSFAGQFESHLYVQKHNIADKIKAVWLSAFSERIASYRKTNNLPPSRGIAVIIQQMIDAESAGVGFGINPVDGDRNAQVISVVYGLGEGLVSGELDADTFTVKDEQIESSLSTKKHFFRIHPKGNGTEIAEVSFEKQSMPALGNAHILEISEILKKLQILYGKPQDIEFALFEDKIYLLQSRPITTLGKLPDKRGQFIIWDNSNIIESYPGITSPLTFSFILKVYEAVYRQFCGMMGVEDTEIEKHSNTFANMLGLIEGRVYYNLLSWYKLLALLPGYSLNAEFMEKMMGVKERFELPPGEKTSKFKEWTRIISAVFKMIGNLRSLPKQKRIFTQDFNTTLKKYENKDFSKATADELMYFYMDFEQTLLKKWRAPLVNDFFAMIYFGTMQKLSVKYIKSDNPNLHNDLLCGAKDIISTEPVKRILVLANMIRMNTEALNLFTKENESQILEELQKDQYKEINSKVQEYLRRFGERCVGELKLETITYSQNPEAFIKILKSYALQSDELPESSGYDVKLRKKAEEIVNKALRGKFLKKWIFKYFLRGARNLVSDRENLRYERTRAFGMVRKIFSSMGKQFYSEGLIEAPRDIFYLKKEEIFDFIQGTSVNRSLKDLISLRKKEYGEYEAKITSERIRTYGIVYHGNDFATTASSTITEDGDLKGIGCCAGVIRAKVRVVRDPSEVAHLGGDILVTSSTDPGWVTLFPSASGILVERGSLLSHSAIVSREMGKPCIVSISNLLQILNTGDLVEMDGSTGIVKIIEKANG